MSWSISIIGMPEKVNAKLDEYGDTLTGASKQEFDEVKLCLQALVSANVVSGSNLVKLVASGHATFEGDTKKYGNCNVSLENTYVNLVLLENTYVNLAL